MWLVFCLSLCWGYRSFQWGGWCLAFLNLWLPVAAFRWPQEDSGILPEYSRFRGFWEAKAVKNSCWAGENHWNPWEFSCRVNRRHPPECIFMLGPWTRSHPYRGRNTDIVFWICQQNSLTNKKHPNLSADGNRVHGQRTPTWRRGSAMSLGQKWSCGPTVSVRYQLLFGPTCEAAAPCLRVCPMWQEPRGWLLRVTGE